MSFDAVLDSAAGVAYLAVFDGGEKRFSSSAPMRGREAAKLPVWVEGELEKHGLKLADVGRWTVGSSQSLRLNAYRDEDTLEFKIGTLTFAVE